MKSQARKNHAWQPKVRVKSQTILHGFDNFTRFQAASADFLPDRRTARRFDANRLQVRVKATTSFVVRVRNVISKLRTFSADITAFCHIFKASKNKYEVYKTSFL
jgi:hypothetical protein